MTDPLTVTLIATVVSGLISTIGFFATASHVDEEIAGIEEPVCNSHHFEGWENVNFRVESTGRYGDGPFMPVADQEAKCAHRFCPKTIERTTDLADEPFDDRDKACEALEEYLRESEC